MTNDTMTSDAPAHDLGTDPRPGLASVFAACGELIDSVAPAELTLPTPCDGMDVRAMLGHLVMVAGRVSCAARRVPPLEWPADVTGLADDAWAPAYHAAVASALGDWQDDDQLDAQMVLPWAAMSGREVVAIYTNEVIVHGWDLGRAVGREVAWDDGALHVALAAIRSQLPDADRDPLWAAVQASLPPEVPWRGAPFANAVEVPDDAPLVDQVVAWNGRRP